MRVYVQVCGTLVSMSKDGMLSKAAFDRCIRDIVPASLLDTEEKTSFSVLLSSIFFSFDRDNRCIPAFLHSCIPAFVHSCIRAFVLLVISLHLIRP